MLEPGSEEAIRLEIRGGRSPEEYIEYLRTAISTTILNDDQLRELVRIHRDAVIASGSLGSVQKEPKVKASKAKGKSKPVIDMDDLFGELDGLV